MIMQVHTKMLFTNGTNLTRIEIHIILHHPACNYIVEN